MWISSLRLLSWRHWRRRPTQGRLPASPPHDPPPYPDKPPDHVDSVQTAPPPEAAVSTSVSRDLITPSGLGTALIVPRDYAKCDITHLAAMVSDMFQELVRANGARGPLPSTRFHSRAPPAISVRDYLQRLATHGSLTPAVLLSAIYYADRLGSLMPAFAVGPLTVHRFLIAAVTVGAKALTDHHRRNESYARIGGVRASELCVLELELLRRLEWKILPTHELLVGYYYELVARAPGYELEEPEGRE